MIQLSEIAMSKKYDLIFCTHFICAVVCAALDANVPDIHDYYNMSVHSESRTDSTVLY